MHHRFTKAVVAVAAAALALLPAPLFGADKDDFKTTTPIKHVVVIFQENISFDHYFGTYPHAKPNNDSTSFFAAAKDDTPRVNGLEQAGLLTNNPNAANPPWAADRFRISTTASSKTPFATPTVP